MTRFIDRLMADGTVLDSVKWVSDDGANWESRLIEFTNGVKFVVLFKNGEVVIY